MKKEKSPRLLSATNKTFAQSKKQLKRWFLKNPNRLVIRIKTYVPADEDYIILIVMVYTIFILGVALLMLR